MKNNLIPESVKKNGDCFLCVSKKTTKKEVVVLEDGTEVCSKHFMALLRNRKKDDAPLFDRKTA